MINILLIDDDEEEHLIMRRVLKSIQNVQYSLHCATNFETGLTQILSNQHDIGFIDFRLGRDSGLDLLKAAIQANCEIPLVLLTGQGNHDIDIAAMECGAMDYLNKKEVNAQLLERTIRYAIERKKTENQLKKLNQQLQHLSEHDILTGIANRNQFNQRFPIVAKNCMYKQSSLAVMFLDLDGFKQVNDTLGHDYGDALLQQFTLRVKSKLTGSEHFFRLGGDEFVIIMEGEINEEQVIQFSQAIVAITQQPFVINDQTVSVSVSIGISFTEGVKMPQPPQQLLKEADIAMYMAKQNGRNNYHFYNKSPK